MISDNVFVNCPFDKEYKEYLQVILFSLKYFGKEPKLTTTFSKEHDTRINKIMKDIEDCQYSIHDISRNKCNCKGDEEEYYRLNMPFELGLFKGYYENTVQTEKNDILVICNNKYDWQKALSDYQSFDIKTYKDKLELMDIIREWMQEDHRLKQKLITRRENFFTFLKDGFSDEGVEDTDEEVLGLSEKDFICYFDDWKKKW